MKTLPTLPYCKNFCLVTSKMSVNMIVQLNIYVYEMNINISKICLSSDEVATFGLIRTVLSQIISPINIDH